MERATDATDRLTDHPTDIRTARKPRSSVEKALVIKTDDVILRLTCWESDRLVGAFLLRVSHCHFASFQFSIEQRSDFLRLDNNDNDNDDDDDDYWLSAIKLVDVSNVNS